MTTHTPEPLTPMLRGTVSPQVHQAESPASALPAVHGYRPAPGRVRCALFSAAAATAVLVLGGLLVLFDTHSLPGQPDVRMASSACAGLTATGPQRAAGQPCTATLLR